LSFSGKWIELENISLSEVRLRRPKIVCSPWHVVYEPKTNTAVLWDLVTLWGGHTWEIYDKEGN
jgi:hypothetical protein